MMHMAFHFNNPTNLIFGRGTRMELGRQKMPGRKALLLLSNGNSTKVNGSFDCVTQQLTEAGVAYTVFRKIMENPRKEVVMEGAAFAREQGCDFILALGGGAVLRSTVGALSRIWIRTRRLGLGLRGWFRFFPLLIRN